MRCVLGLFIPLGTLGLMGQDAPPREAPPWGLGLLLGRTTENRDNIYGSNHGVDLSWQFLRNSPIQGRVRGTYLHVNQGSGSASRAPAEGDFIGASCDWILRFTKPHGPYLLAGVGIGHHDIKFAPYSGNPAYSTSGAYFSNSWGLGYLIRGRVELELRRDEMEVDWGWGGSTKNAICISLVVRRRF